MPWHVVHKEVMVVVGVACMQLSVAPLVFMSPVEQMLLICGPHCESMKGKDRSCLDLGFFCQKRRDYWVNSLWGSCLPSPSRRTNLVLFPFMMNTINLCPGV